MPGPYGQGPMGFWILNNTVCQNPHSVRVSPSSGPCKQQVLLTAESLLKIPLLYCLTVLYTCATVCIHPIILSYSLHSSSEPILPNYSPHHGIWWNLFELFFTAWTTYQWWQCHPVACPTTVNLQSGKVSCAPPRSMLECLRINLL